MHWASDYLGLAWVNGEHDCWAFARRVWREQWALDVPAVDVDAARALACARVAAEHARRLAWHLVEPGAEREGDAVLLARGDHPTHVGVWVAPTASSAGVLHCLQGAGVVYTPAGQLAAQGWPHRLVYRHPALQAAAGGAHA